jgi:3-phosphoshikimate 1-carboxyvinyltransferase
MRLITPSKINGTINAPPSKSMTGRAISAALLAGGISEIINPSSCDDAQSAMHVAYALGAEIVKKKQRIFVKGNPGLSCNLKGRELDCGESALAMRMFTPIAGLASDKIKLTASGSLCLRTMKMVEELEMLGALCKTNRGYAPIVVKGPIKGGVIKIDASISSQFLTGLLMALPVCKYDSKIIVSNLKSKPYVEMTISLLKDFGVKIACDKSFKKFYIERNQSYKPCAYKVEGDWSGASFLLVAGAIAGAVKVKGLNPDSIQADKSIIEALKKVGARIKIEKDYVSIERNELKAFDFDATDCPDLFPPLVALASSCEGKSIIHGVERLKHKESDRASALALEFTRLGISIRVSDNRMEIRGDTLKGNAAHSHNDHRIVMATAVAGLNAADGITIKDWECVSKSYPEFFSDLERLKVAT